MILHFCSALVRPPTAELLPALEFSALEQLHPAGASPEEPPELLQGVEPLCSGARLRELELFNLGTRRLRETSQPIPALKGFSESWKGTLDTGLE